MLGLQTPPGEKGLSDRLTLSVVVFGGALINVEHCMGTLKIVTLAALVVVLVGLLDRGLVKLKRMQKAKMAGCDKVWSISILKLNKLHVLFYFSTYRLPVNILCKEYILLFRLIISQSQLRTGWLIDEVLL